MSMKAAGKCPLCGKDLMVYVMSNGKEYPLPCECQIQKQKADEKRTGAFAVFAGDPDADSRGRVWTEPGGQQQSVLSGQRDQLAELEAYGEK